MKTNVLCQTIWISTRPILQKPNHVNIKSSNHHAGLLSLSLDVWNTSKTVCALTQLRLVDGLCSVEGIEYAIPLGRIASLFVVSIRILP